MSEPAVDGSQQDGVDAAPHGVSGPTTNDSSATQLDGSNGSGVTTKPPKGPPQATARTVPPVELTLLTSVGPLPSGSR
jgi:hypothetical protein